MNNTILRSPDDLDQLKKMLTQDAMNNGREIWFGEEEPFSYPCLAMIDEIDNVSIQIDFEDDESEDEIQEKLEQMEGVESFIYTFKFILKTEIEELLNA